MNPCRLLCFLSCERVSEATGKGKWRKGGKMWQVFVCFFVGLLEDWGSDNPQRKVEIRPPTFGAGLPLISFSSG